MSISQTQIRKATQKAIQSILKKGKQPNKNDIKRFVENSFLGKIPGLPFFTPRLVEKYEVSDKDAYNTMFSELDEDLDTLFQMDTYENNRIMAMFDYYASEKTKLDAGVDKLQLRIDNIYESLKSKKVTKGFTQSFDNFYGIEMTGNPNRNIPKTTAFIDLEQRKVYNEKLSKPQDKIDISEAKCNVEPTSDVVGEFSMGTISNILKDSINETYIYTATSTSDGECSISVDVDLKETSVISRIVLQTPSTRNCIIRVSISENDVNYKDLISLETNSIAEWNFSRTKVKYIKFSITKKEPDGHDGVNYEYYFSIVNISIMNDTFMNKGIYVSQPMIADKVIDSIAIVSNDISYPGTNVKYYIGLDNDVNKIDWRLVSNNVKHDMGLLDSTREIVSDHYDGYGEDVGYGNRVCQLHPEHDLGTVQVIPGYQMWYRDTLNVSPFAKDSEEPFKPLLREYDKTKIVDSAFVDCDVMDMSIGDDSMIVLTQYVNSSSNAAVHRRRVTGDVSYSLYINNVIVQPTNGEYSVHLKEGQNKIQLLVHSTSSASFSHNFNFKNVSFNIFARLDLKQLNQYSFIQNTRPDNINVYTVDSEGYIVVKNNPTHNVVNKPGEDGGIRYLLNYKYIPDNIKFRKTKFRLMASLVSEYDDLSPQILDYKIITD